MIVPVVTGDLAIQTLPAAAMQALSARPAAAVPDSSAAEDLALLRSVHTVAELAVSASAYAIGLVWWFSLDRGRRVQLLDGATELLTETVTQSTDDAPLASGFSCYARRLAQTAMTPIAHAGELQLQSFSQHEQAIDELTVRFASATVEALLLVGQSVFGEPDTSAERMRDTMTSIAFRSAA